MDQFLNELYDDLNNKLLKFDHPILIWFNDNYERIEDYSNEDYSIRFGILNQQNVLTYLSLKEIFFFFKESDYYKTLTSKTKKKATFRYLKNLINYKGLFKGDYVESSDKIQASSIDTIHTRRIQKCHLLKGWKLKNKD